MLKQVTTAWSVLNTQGPAGFARVSLERAGMWWRRGELLEFGRYIGRPSQVVRIDGCRFTLDAPMVSTDLGYLLASGKHEARERSMVKRFMDPDLPLIELGGAVGVVSCVANRRLTDPSRHVVVEANPALFPALVKNRELNGCGFTVLNSAIAYDAAVTRFHPAADVLCSSVRPSDGPSIVVPSTTFQAIADRFGFEDCTLVCDIEGAEIPLIRTEAQALSRHVRMFIMELHERQVGADAAGEVLDTLRGSGFEVVERLGEVIALRNTRRRGSATQLSQSGTSFLSR